MKVLIQRVLSASVTVNEEVIGSIEHGYLLYVCFENQDTVNSIEQAVNKIKKLRIFEDENSKMNHDIFEKKGAILSISQFTLSWDGSKGHLPSFEKSMPPQQAKIFYRTFNDKLKESGLNVESGLFGAEMKVVSTNDGPVTFILNF